MLAAIQSSDTLQLLCLLQIPPFLPARRSKQRLCYGNMAGWVAGWLDVTAGIVSKRLNLSLTSVW